MRLTLLLCALVALQACSNPEREPFRPKTRTESRLTIDSATSDLDDSKISSLFNSELKEQCSRLELLKPKYRLEKYASCSFNETNIGRHLNIAVDHESKYISGSEVDGIRNKIHSASSASLKGTVPMYKGAGGSTYARVEIDELIFIDSNAAVDAMDFFEKLKKDKRGKYDISKAPSYFVRDENKLYFILTGGNFMVGIGDEIKEEIEKRLNNDR